MKTKHHLLGASCAVLASLAATPAFAQDSGVSISVSVDYVSEYVFRGVTLAEGAVQPGVEFAFGDFYAGAWYSAAFGEDSNAYADEIDLYAGYGFAVNDVTSLDVGITYYHYPEFGDIFETEGGTAGTYEVFGGASFDTILAPSVYAYYDFTLENFTLEGSVSHSIPAGEKVSFDLGLTAGLVDVDGGGSYEYGLASAGLSYAFTDDVSAYANANYGLSSEDTFFDVDLDAGQTNVVGLDADDNSFWVGVGIAAGF